MFKKVIGISGHTDDVEFGAGGTVHRLKEEGATVDFVTFSWADQEELIEESKNSAKILGVDNFTLHNFERRNFPKDRQKILDELIKLRENNYDLVLVPNSGDVHQDHSVVSIETVRAFKERCTIWGYILPHNTVFGQDPRQFVKLSAKNVETKIDAIKCYQSQFKKNKIFFSVDVVMSYLRSWGSEILVEFAEKFEVIRGVY